MDIRKAVGSVEILYAHAIALEQEAAARYREFAESMRDHGNEEVAELFERLASLESAHAERLARDHRELAVPDLEPGEYAWIDTGPEAAAAHEWVLRLASPYDALKIALAGEERARDFFRKVLDIAETSDVRALATEMLKDEADHIEWVKNALGHVTNPTVNWESLFAHRKPEFLPGGGHEIPVAGRKGRRRAAPAHMRQALAKKRV
ncbi:MAG: ferritin family protein, partial [Burkholderiales bacterium]